MPAKKGPKRAHKLKEDVLAFVLAQLEAEPALKAPELAQRVEQQLAIKVHPRSVGRALSRREKKAAQARETKG